MNEIQPHPSPFSPVDYDPFADSTPLAEVVPSTEAQREIWLACQLGGDATLAYNESITLDLKGSLDIAALGTALQALVERHDALRATFSADGEQMLIAEHLQLDLPVDDLRAQSPAIREAALQAAAQQAVSTPFDLRNGPLLRARLLRLADDHAALVLSAHHMVYDGWSFGVLMRDLGLLLTGRRDELPAPAGFAAFARALSERNDSAEAAADESYWLGRFATLPPVLELPFDHPRGRSRGFASQRVDHLLPADLVAALRQYGARCGATLFSTMLAGFGALMQRLSGNDEVVVGVPAAGQTLPGFEDTVGHGVNLLPLRLAPDPAAPLAMSLSQVQASVLDAFEHQHYTFGTLLQKLLVERDPSRIPLAPVMFNLDQAMNLDDFGALQIQLHSNPRRAENFELFVNAVPQTGGSLLLECQYASWLYDEQTVLRWLACFEALLRGICTHSDAPLGDLPIVTGEDHSRLLELNSTEMPLPQDLRLHVLLQAQAARSPQAVALRHGGDELSYAQLWARAHRLAHALRARGVQRGTRVGLCLPRDADMLPALLAVLVAGAGYVPLDPGFPAARLRDMAEDAQLALLLTKAECAEALPWPREHSLWLDADVDEIERHPETPPGADTRRDATGDSLAYMIYTSGSTGKPKGVMLPHKAVVNFLLAVAKRPGLAPGDCLLAVTTLSFDIAVLELLFPLSVGATVVLASREQAADGFALRALLEESGANAMQATPSTWRLLFGAGWGGTPGLKALVGGEPLPVDLAAQLRRSCGSVWNMYGPTETTVWSTCWELPGDGTPMAIGTPLANTQVWILDSRGGLCPIGVPGEIHIGGASVALGYWQREQLTAERFLPNTFADGDGNRMYRTGDRGRWRNDGLLEHLGRLDFQVKLRGFRIELGDVESHLADHPQVAQALAMVREDVPGDARLVAYVVARDPASPPATGDLREHLKQGLPAYMIPQHVVPLPALPLLPNGKIDRKQLPSPLAAHAVPAVRRRLPQTATQKMVAQTMEQVLRLPGLALDDDFFALGGHSLVAAQLAARLREHTGLDVQMRTVFDAPTIEGLTRWIDTHAGDASAQVGNIARRADPQRAPATLQQGRIWFLEQLNPGLPTFNTPSAHRLRGPLDAQALERAINAMVARQESLRTVIVEEDGVPVQRVFPELQVRLGAVQDLSSLPPAQREVELMARLQARTAEVFDLSESPLFKIGLYRMSEQYHVLFFMPHHIIWDGWSFDLIYDELAALYPACAEHRSIDLPPLAVGYGDYASWQQQWLQSDELRRQLAYWQAQLTPLPAPLNLPRDHPRPKMMSGGGNTHWFRYDAAWFETLQAFARARDATPFMLLLSAFATLLWQQSGQTDLIIGTPVRGRPSVELERVMGFFVNALPLRIRVDPEKPFVDLLRQVRTVVLDAFAAQDAPLEQMVQFASVARDASRSPIYQSFFSYQDVRQRNQHWGPLEQENLGIYQPAAVEDVRLWFMALNDGVTGGLTYNTDIFEAPRVAGWMERYSLLLDEAMTHPLVALQALPSVQAVGASTLAEATAPMQLEANVSATPAPGAPPQTESERLLAGIWAELLGTADIQTADNFFDLGGHSLLVMEALSRMERLTSKRISPRHYIVGSLAQVALAYDGSKAEGKGLLRRLFGKRNDAGRLA